MQFFMPMKPPRTTHQTKSVNATTGKPVFFENPELKEARAKLSAHLAQHRPAQPFDSSLPLRVMVKWLFPTRKKSLHGKFKQTRPDTHNLNKLLFDVMTDLKFWNDDAQVASEIIEKFWTVETPGIWIQIEEV
ncbi:RusA family crossover junction endodeoxyribonuclease [Candidatus Sumerlaeota bacterium]|nr:RusA family crossover junction endodeoxyribonuclease [Candidatus Sumerlaeota bacterium]